jgi:ribosomal-protein-alanine N-acetyltransferase
MIETERLLIRDFTPADLDALATMRADEEVAKYIGTTRMQTRAKVEERLKFYLSCYEKYGFGVSGVIYKQDGKLIGWSGLQPLEDSDQIEVGYGFDKPYWRQGFATEVAAAWLRYGFEHVGLERIVAVAVPENYPSRHVMEKLGMKFEKYAHYYGLECVFYAITRAEFVPVDSFYVLHNSRDERFSSDEGFSRRQV